MKNLIFIFVKQILLTDRDIEIKFSLCDKEKMTSKPRYTKLSQKEHVLRRPGMYVGELSVELSKKENIIEEGKIIKKDIYTSTAIEKLFWEILTNATDNIPKSKKLGLEPKLIKITVSKDKKTITIENDGRTLDLSDNGEGADMIFSEFLSGENFDDDDVKEGAGLYGLGSKLTNLFSLEFIVEAGCSKTKLYYYRKYEKNIEKMHDRIIKPYDGKNFVRITYTLDFERFYKGTDLKRCYTDDMIALFKMHAYGSSYAANIPMEFNGKLIDMRNIKNYVGLMYNLDKVNYIIFNHEYSAQRESEKDKSKKIEYKESAELMILDTPDKGRFISFVNGTITKEGGKHVEAWYDLITKYIKKNIKLENKKAKLTKTEIKKHFTIVVKVTLGNPTFRGQIKDKLLNPNPKTKADEKTLAKIMKWKAIETIKSVMDFKEKQKEVPKTKKEKFLDGNDSWLDADEAGGNESWKCTLLLVEGKSAKASAIKIISAMPVNDRKYYGIMVLRGVPLNVMNSDEEKFQKNKELHEFYKVLGLNDGVDYSIDENFYKLRYGEVMFLTDADRDGIHIKGLGIVLFEERHPTLLQREEFLKALVTPLIRVKVGREIKYFYTKNQYAEWAKKMNSKIKPKYIKGLGSLVKEDQKYIAEEFMAVTYSVDDESREKLVMAFHKGNSDERKVWLKTFKKDYIPFIPTEENDKQRIGDFVDKELIIFSTYSNWRSIPGLDGLKPGQRKIIYTVFKQSKKDMEGEGIKVSQLGAATSQLTAYEHGEYSLEETIFKLGQSFPGSNNIPLLKDQGEIGSLLEGGDDHGGSRYVYITIPKYLPYIFRKEDEIILEHDSDDGELKEPLYYLPTIPLCVINGAGGIGTGYSTDIPCHNPDDIIKWLEAMLKIRMGEKVDLDSLPALMPWYRYYRGKIYMKKKKIYSEGKIKTKDKNIHVTELPIGIWPSNYEKNVLNPMMQKKEITGYKPMHVVVGNDCKIDFKITGGEDASIKHFKLRGKISCSNLVLFNQHMKLQKFTDIKSILFAFFNWRIQKYEERRLAYIKILQESANENEKKSQFLQDVVNEKLIIRKRKDKDLEKEMKELGYDLKYLQIPIGSQTIENSEKYREKARQAREELEEYKKSNACQIWYNELQELKGVLKF